MAQTTGSHVLYSASGSTFEIGRILGDGGMGKIYLAQQRRNVRGENPERLVALKLLQPSSHAQARRLFYHEGSLLPRLNHPNIVRCLERGRGIIPGTGHVDYLALGYVAGETIEDLMQQRKVSLPPTTVLGIVAQITAALSYLHQRGIVHCDVKPNNIMLEHAAPNAVLLDFGIARASDFVGPLVAVGTPQYMAPEQVKPRSTCDGRTDLYALGIIIYELLSGRRLFPYRKTTDIQQGKMITPDRGTIAHVLGDILSQVVLRCLREDPNDRYATADELFTDLRRAI